MTEQKDSKDGKTHEALKEYSNHISGLKHKVYCPIMACSCRFSFPVVRIDLCQFIHTAVRNSLKQLHKLVRQGIDKRVQSVARYQDKYLFPKGIIYLMLTL